MQKEIFKLVATGPESSGKTTLSRMLAASLKTVWVPEFARGYVAGLGRPYTEDDLLRIASGQKHWEDWYGARARNFLVCDTDWTVIRIWNDYRFGNSRINNLLEQYVDTRVHYFLCAPDFDWIPDPLRENPSDRDLLFRMYRDLLDRTGALYTVLEGMPEIRLKKALFIIRKHL